MKPDPDYVSQQQQIEAKFIEQKEINAIFN
jgi:hypothetical protein